LKKVYYVTGDVILDSVLVVLVWVWFGLVWFGLVLY